jgi:transcriptional regulator with XRE-family HTH domain
VAVATLVDVNDRAIGRTLRAIRRQLGLRQADVAARVGCSQWEISQLELGRIGDRKVERVRHAFAVLGGSLVLTPTWRGGDLDRVLDEDHARLVSKVAGILRAHGWSVETEVTFSVYGERGSVDLVGWHAPTRTLLVIEVKTEITSVEETMRRHDVKVRLAPSVWRERTGEVAASTVRLLVVAESSQNRRRLLRHSAVFLERYPLRGRAVRAWLAAPTQMAGGLWMLRP